MPDTRRPWRIDFHHHVVPPKYLASTPMPLRLPQLDEQLEIMDQLGIRIALTSVTPRVLDAHAEKLAEVARACNEFQAENVRDNPARFGAFAVLPLPEIDASLKEIAYALDVLRLDGVGLFSSAQGVYLADERLEPVFAELQRRRAVIFVHPSHCIAPAEWNLQVPEATLEYSFDATRAIVNMLYCGTIDRCPDVRFVLSHGGGTLPYLIHLLPRVSQAARERLPNLVGSVQSLYFDVASTMGRYALRSLQELAGAEHLVWGSDLPFVSPAWLAHELEEWEAYDGFDASQRAAIEHRTAVRLLPRLAAQTA